jgi:regulatory protein YycH of two-component signal transduction system YycFG
MLALGGLTVFGFEAIGTAQQLFSDPDVVRFNKGAFYMFGAGIVLVVLSFVLMYEFWYGNPLTANLTVAVQGSV